MKRLLLLPFLLLAFACRDSSVTDPDIAAPGPSPQPDAAVANSSCDFFDDFESGSFSEEWVVEGDASRGVIPEVVAVPGAHSGQYVAKMVGAGLSKHYDPNGKITHYLGHYLQRATFTGFMQLRPSNWAWVDIFIGFDPLGSGWDFWLWSPTSAYKEPGSQRWSHYMPMFRWTKVDIEYDRDLNGGTVRFYEDDVLRLTLPNHGTAETSFQAWARALYRATIEYWLDDVCINFELTNQPPVADAGPDQTVECTSCDGTPVTLDGTGSSDPDSDPLTYTWTGPFSDGGGTVTGPTPTVTLPLGSHTITLTVDDENGATDTDDVQIDVVDSTPPSIDELTATPDELWPPNHRMVSVDVLAVASDVCDEAPQCAITDVASNEPDEGLGDGDFPNDIVITGDWTLDLRAERSALGSGRVYTITVECVDASGNETEAAAEVTVPLDKGRRP